MEDAQVNAGGDTHQRVQALLADKAVSQAELARLTGVSASALNRWLKGTYDGDNAGVEAKLMRWLHERERQTEFLLPEAPGWIETPIGERVLAALSYGQMAADLVVVYGGAGLGKTTASERYAATRPNVWIATMSADTGTPSACLEEILEALGMKEGPGGGAARMRRALVQRLRGTRGLLIIDEAQHLNVNALEVVRAIHDRAQIGVALIGNERIYSRLAAAGQAALFAQLYSRIGKRVSLMTAQRVDVEALTQPWGINDPQTLAYLWTIARTPGALRGIVKTLRLATMFARGAGEALNLAHIKAAWTELGGNGRSNGSNGNGAST